MANEDFDWAAFVNFDPEFHAPVSGYDMQGVAAGEVAGPTSYHSDKESSHRSAELAAYHNNCRSPDQATEALWIPHHNGPFNHNLGLGETVGRNNGHSNEPNPADSGAGGFPTYMPPSPITSNPVVLNPPVNVRPNSPTNALNLKPCVCISCTAVGSKHHVTIVDCHPYLAKHPCRFPDCTGVRYNVKDIISHEHEHYREEGQYPCKDEHCNYTTKRWSDFKRHAGSKHCTSPANRFSCPVLWCKYSGSNGFARKDKLQSHYKTVHPGKVGPGKANKVIKPKTSGAV